MIRLFTLLLFPAILLTADSAAQSSADTSHKTVDLNEFVVRKAGEIRGGRRSTIKRTSLIMREHGLQNRRTWDSIMLLTRFPAPSSRPMILQSVSGRLAALDTSKLDLFLVILQLRDADTLQKRILLEPSMLKQPEMRFEIDLRDSLIALAPSPFYLGFAFRTKTLSEDYSFPFYYTKGGEGVVLSTPGYTWMFVSQRNPVYIFPFRIRYVDGA